MKTQIFKEDTTQKAGMVSVLKSGNWYKEYIKNESLTQVKLYKEESINVLVDACNKLKNYNERNKNEP